MSDVMYPNVERSKHLTIATVLYGGRTTIEETLPTWFRSFGRCRVNFIFVDNTPDDEVASSVHQMAIKEHVEYTYIRRPNNPGFAASANEAIARSSSEWVFLVNPDVYLRADAAKSILQHIQVKEANTAAISLLTKGKLSSGVALTPFGFLVDRKLPSSRPPLGPSGGAALISRDAFMRAGKFDSDMFAWGEDADLALRLWSAGITTVDLDLHLDHIGGHSVSSLNVQRLKTRHLARNRIVSFRRNFSPLSRAIIAMPYLTALGLNFIRKLGQHTAEDYCKGIIEGLLAPNSLESTHPLTPVELWRYWVNYPALQEREMPK